MRPKVRLLFQRSRAGTPKSARRDVEGSASGTQTRWGRDPICTEWEPLEVECSLTMGQDPSTPDRLRGLAPYGKIGWILRLHLHITLQLGRNPPGSPDHAVVGSGTGNRGGTIAQRRRSALDLLVKVIGFQ